MTRRTFLGGNQNPLQLHGEQVQVHDPTIILLQENGTFSATKQAHQPWTFCIKNRLFSLFLQ